MEGPGHQAQTKGAPLPPGDADTYINDGDHFEITIKFAPEKHSQSWLFRQDIDFEDILMALGHQWPDYDFLKSKAIVEKKRQTSSTASETKTKSLLKTPDDDNLPMHLYAGTSLRFMAPKKAALDSLKAGQAEVARREAALQAQRRMAYKPSPSHSSSRGGIHTLSGPVSSASAAADSQHTFQQIRPLNLPHLTNPSRSLAFLHRLASDPGIRAVMKSHKFTVGLLTEMDPAAYTQANHEGVTRILGLNRNKGQVIELRLRTDAYDGYRDYKTIRNTLCHELAHNVWGEHDRNFWDLCNAITKEVERADYNKGGRTVGGDDYTPGPVSNQLEEEENAVYDHGGWTGGTYVLGGGGDEARPSGSSAQSASRSTTEGLTRREIMAKAVEERLKRLKREEGGGGKDERRERSGNGNGSQG
ncbi:WLM-domain-containing protein [Sordaria brevicollis]|uniref:WLM-domain-containing protein n=1 Tax=Sordaria brevicollis TaxID=83679 RepID=A0AAE0PCJ4_SORBR|nr:WLM-domain-containing protein [Sordaria brevicollis]